MELSTWLLYVSVISLLIFSPGPSTLLCVSDGLKFGKKKSIPTVLGGAIAALVLMTLSASGLGAILVASETLFLIIKLCGALYLIFLGWSAWKEGGTRVKINPLQPNNPLNYSLLTLFQKGFMVGISNPKDLLFFIALFPSFMNTDLPAFEQFTVLAATWFIIDCTAMFMYAGLGSKISPWLGKQRTSPKRPWRTGLFVIEAMATGGLVARRKPLTKSTDYPVRPVGWISKRSTPLSEHLQRTSHSLRILPRI